MGTRNMTAIYIDGEYKVAQYGQWDGYPAGSGANIVDALQHIIAEGGLNAFADNVRGCVALDSDDVTRRYHELGIKGEWISLDDAERFKEAYPQLDRDMGSDIITYIYENGPQDVFLQLDFVADNLFCEWAYVVDLDAQTLEVYTGYGTDHSPENRFAFLSSDGVIYPLDTVTFDEVANTSVEELVAKWEELEKDFFDN